MDRHLISRIAHTDHPIAAPLFDDSVQRLLDRALTGDAERLLDLGCGEGPWLLRALAARPKLHAVGVDLDTRGLTIAQQAAAALGVSQRLGLHHQDAREFSHPEPFDAVLCVGATHAFGGLLPTLTAIDRHLAPGGLALVGEAFWAQDPDEAALAGLGGMAATDYDDLATTVDRVVAAGWTPVYGYVSSRPELDDYEFSWTGSLAAWALDHPEDPDSAEAAAVAAEHRTGWLRGYRGTFGFVTLVLRRAE
ncbi:methyltransferase domain-containing protein [Kitasatospora sp. GP82]|uniref:SAM-dependent methyltransferase n=1 Tax=Kitasatospora sp. GP82 TaxID=3035089 RepID=UPI002474EC7C|nr:methyltransferase domain-containing protein [Kitasatospora sp. GP82]MDH6128185.1 cyclopropane fatty-acyl-phospholipid synthase-like methyltransferase [Kitasatospora sp. GP82]